MTDVAGAPIAGAEVRVDRPAPRSLGVTRSDGVMDVPRDTAIRWLVVRHIGYVPERVRWTGAPTTVTLVPASSQLRPVVVRARTPRSEGAYPRPGESERVATASSGMVGSGALGDLTGMLPQLGGIPGEGVGSFGAPGSLSRIRFGGAQAPVAQLPRGSKLVATLLRSPFDPAVGGVAGATLEVEIEPQSSFVDRQVSAWTTRTDAGAGSRIGTIASWAEQAEVAGTHVSAAADVEFAQAPTAFLDCGASRIAAPEVRPALLDAADAARRIGLASRCDLTYGPRSAVATARLDRPVGGERDGSLLVYARAFGTPGAAAADWGLSAASTRARGGSALVAFTLRDTTRGESRSLDRIAVSASSEADGAAGAYWTIRPGLAPSAATAAPTVAVKGAPEARTLRRAALEFSSRRTLGTTARGTLAFTAFGRVAGATLRETENPERAFASPTALFDGRSTESGGIAIEGGGEAGTLAAGASLGGVRRLSRKLRVIGGARVDAVALRLAGGSDARSVTVSPRLGIEWSPEPMEERGLDISGPMMVPQFGFAAVRFGVGRYVGWLDEVEAAERSLQPVARGPYRCGADGTIASPACPQGMAVTVPAPARSRVVAATPVSNWRASASLEYKTPLADIALDASSGVTSGEWLSRDANLTPRAGVVDGDRAIHSAVGAISPLTGRIPLVESRRDPAAGHVFEWTSTGRRIVHEVALVARPRTPDRLFLQVALTARDVRRRFSPLEAPADAGPDALGVAPGIPRHQLAVNAGVRVAGARVHLFAASYGGVPVVPVVAGDVNGDGLSNDGLRAAQAAVDHPAWSAAQRRCVRDAAVGGGSCTGPVALTSWLQVDWGPGTRYQRFADRVTWSLWWADPLALFARGIPVRPGDVDRRAVTVSGFDPATARYTYAANPGFLRPSTERPPWRVGLNVSIQLAEDLPTQDLRRSIIARPAAQADIPRVVARYRRSVVNPWSLALASAEEIGLSEGQARRFEAEEALVDDAVDAILRAFVERTFRERERLSVEALVDGQIATITAVWEVMKGQRAVLLPLLTPDQRGRLPRYLEYLMTVSTPISFGIR